MNFSCLKFEFSSKIKNTFSLSYEKNYLKLIKKWVWLPSLSISHLLVTLLKHTNMQRLQYLFQTNPSLIIYGTDIEDILYS